MSLTIFGLKVINMYGELIMESADKVILKTISNQICTTCNRQ